MANSQYLKVTIDGQPVDLTSTNLQIPISYHLEDSKEFKVKKSSEAFNVVIPATVQNDQISNTYHNPSIEDLTEGKSFRGYRRAIIEANGDELLFGKAFLTEATHTDRPVSYEYDFYGNNGDWIIELKELTLFDLLKHIKFLFTKEAVTSSWSFTGTSEALPYVFAPVRYRAPVDFYDETVVDGDYKDVNMTPLYMKPSISVYWLFYWAFKSVGYRIQSEFFDKPYFRRQVMPWVWGNFLNAQGNRQDNIKFLAKGTEKIRTPHLIDGYADVKSDNVSTDGGYDTNGVYQYTPASGEMKWTYLPVFDYGRIKATFYLQLDWYVFLTTNTGIEINVEWKKNGLIVENHDVIHQSTGPTQPFQKREVKDDNFSIEVEASDVITAQIYVKATGSTDAYADLQVIELSLTEITTPLGGLIDFENYNGLKNHKFMDLLAGTIDNFNLIPGTDPVNKVVVFEPAHPYSIVNDISVLNTGYFNHDYIDWSEKQDLTQKSKIVLYGDYERELTLKFKDDSNDGLLKKVQERNSTTLAAGKYVFPERFKAEKKGLENRFFSPVMHYEVQQWKSISDPAITPQMICIVPENVSNTSNDESQNTFQPKLAYYKGLVTSDGGWRFDGEDLTTFPYMFAVNYHPGGENDPVLSYSDEQIGSVKAKGLLRRFFLQRFAIMRNGQFYTTYFNLVNKDVTNWLHREHKICRSQRWELVTMTDYQPLGNESTGCFLRKWSPITEADVNAVYPSFRMMNIDKYDMKYSPLKCLVTDVPGAITEA